MSFISVFNVPQVIKRALLAAVAVKTTEENINKKQGIVCRPTELPIYSPDIPTPLCIETEKPTWLGALIESKVASLRQVIENINHEVEAYKLVVQEYTRQGIDQADDILTYLRRENETAPKVGAIAIGGLTGLILSLRKGYFKKTLYMGSGAMIMTAVCYPKQTSIYTQKGLEEGKKYVEIAYNFAYGVKKGEPPMELPSLPQLPASLSEAWDSVYKTASSLFLDKADSDNTCFVLRTGDDLSDNASDEADEEVKGK